MKSPKVNLNSMKQRCYNPKELAYKSYGGKGITICDEWLNDSSAFVEWAMENGWKEGCHIHRKDNNKGYSPDNCEFLDRLTHINLKREWELPTEPLILQAGEFGCLSCGYIWRNKKQPVWLKTPKHITPKQCPRCKSKVWDSCKSYKNLKKEEK